MQAPKAIFEIGLNHLGDKARAFRMIDTLLVKGATHITLQAAIDFSSTTRDAAVIAKVQPNCLSLPDVQEVIAYGKSKGAVMGVAALDPATVEPLMHAGVSFWKVLSSDISYTQLHQEIARTGLPLYLSTGLAHIEDIARALSSLRSVDPEADVRLIHTVLTIPTPRNMLNLNNIPLLKETFGVPVAYGQHSDIRAALPAARALGAETVFVYVAEERVPELPDGPHAVLCREVGDLWTDESVDDEMLGSRERLLTPEEEERRIAIRRSIVARIPIHEGEVITGSMLAYKRPGTGQAPWDAPSIIGSVARKEYQQDEDL